MLELSQFNAAPLGHPDFTENVERGAPEPVSRARGALMLGGIMLKSWRNNSQKVVQCFFIQLAL